MINLTSLDNKIPIDTYGTYIITDLIAKDYQQQIAEAYPTQHFNAFTLQKGNENVDKNFTFQFEFFSVHKVDTITLQKMEFKALWVEFINKLLAKEYIQHLSEMMAMNLGDKKTLIEFSRYRPGDWLDAHYDKQQNKVLTQIFYFNTLWDSNWGGYFHIVNPQNIEQTVLAFPPLINYSIIVKPDPSAWHKVEKVSLNSLQPRLTMVLEFYEK